ncbi:MAG: hypothetical protein JNM94_07655 [Phycisphaerae bacterium]|nr:hypothetical protein [Phycisphaerae bacterium]
MSLLHDLAVGVLAGSLGAGALAADRFTLGVPSDAPDTIELAVLLDGTPTTLALTRRSMRSPDARLFVDRGTGRLEEAPFPRARTYRGEIVGEPGAMVVASILHDGLVAIVERGNGERLFIEPASRADPLAQPGEHRAYRAADAGPVPGTCGSDDLEQPWLGNRARPADGGIAGATTYLTDIAFDADYEFFQKNASSIDFTVADIESIMTQVEFVYTRDVDIAYEISAIVVRTSASDPYTATAASDLLCEFRTQWNGNAEVDIKRDVAHLFTGKNLDGTTVGLAWIEAVCQDIASVCAGSVGDTGYSLVESKFGGATVSQRVALSCHELGHNWGATHCDGLGDCHIMCATIGGCDGITGLNLKFGATEVGQIVAYRNSVACDLALAAPLTIPFSEPFAVSLSSSTWVFNDGASTSLNATNEPSAAYSLNLDSSGSGLYADDDIRTNAILAAATPSVTLSFATQHKGVEAGETLVAEYWSSAEEWVAAVTVTSTGTDQTSFVAQQVVLPANASHDGLRIRFRVDGNETNDDWYVDDVSVVPTVTCTGDLDTDGDVDADDLAVLLGGWGACPGCPGDLNDSGAVNGQDITLLLAVWGPCD